VFEQDVASVGQLHAAALAVKQHGAQLFFQDAHLARDGRLDDVQHVRGLGGAAAFGDGQKGLQLLEVHGL
jgi:hypothetical protein